MERLQKVLAQAGVASRRKAEALIVAGRVTINGQPAKLGAKVAAGDEVQIDGRRIKRPATVTYAYYKPVGELCTVSDERGRRTVLDHLPRLAGLHPVGRLDQDSEGLLLITNDGALTQRLTHPRFGQEKEYRVWCAEGTLSAQALEQLRQGVVLDDGPAAALRAWAAPGGCIVVLGEGRKRQLRRMLAAVGFSVLRLKRTRIAGLKLGNLAPGQYRELTPLELASLGYTEHMFSLCSDRSP
jgi:23S rRNA pseudouridine2605 synthase